MPRRRQQISLHGHPIIQSYSSLRRALRFIQLADGGLERRRPRRPPPARVPPRRRRRRRRPARRTPADPGAARASACGKASRSERSVSEGTSVEAEQPGSAPNVAKRCARRLDHAAQLRPPTSRWSLRRRHRADRPRRNRRETIRQPALARQGRRRRRRRPTARARARGVGCVRVFSRGAVASPFSPPRPATVAAAAAAATDRAASSAAPPAARAGRPPRSPHPPQRLRRLLVGRTLELLYAGLEQASAARRCRCPARPPPPPPPRARRRPLGAAASAACAAARACSFPARPPTPSAAPPPSRPPPYRGPRRRRRRRRLLLLLLLLLRKGARRHPPSAAGATSPAASPPPRRRRRRRGPPPPPSRRSDRLLSLPKHFVSAERAATTFAAAFAAVRPPRALLPSPHRQHHQHHQHGAVATCHCCALTTTPRSVLVGRRRACPCRRDIRGTRWRRRALTKARRFLGAPCHLAARTFAALRTRRARAATVCTQSHMWPSRRGCAWVRRTWMVARRSAPRLRGRRQQEHRRRRRREEATA